MIRFDSDVHCGIRWLAPMSVIGLLLGLPVWGASVGEEYQLTRYFVGTRGQMSSADGATKLVMAIGQRNSSSMNGEDYSLTGEFFFEVVPGDCVLDGEVNALDHGAFAACLTGPDNANISEECRCFDIDRNEVVDMRDAAGFQRNFTGP